MTGGLKPLRWPRFWVGLWWLSIVALIVICLVPLDGLPPLPDNSDKVEHLLGYFVMAAAAVQLYRGRLLLQAAIGLVALGIAIEFAQGMTAYRSADPYDAMFNTLGVLLGMATALSPWRDLLLRLERRLGAGSR
ncbi:MAG: VanZ family protein [Pseudoxanthomonas sp.]